MKGTYPLLLVNILWLGALRLPPKVIPSNNQNLSNGYILYQESPNTPYLKFQTIAVQSKILIIQPI
jgi:hypothetical protein